MLTVRKGTKRELTPKPSYFRRLTRAKTYGGGGTFVP